MWVRVGEDLFDVRKAVHVSHVASPPETVTIYFVDGTSMVFTGETAGALWGWWSTLARLELP